ncbi:hypothetical protein [Massilia sp.]|uniref:hypothetical protein n=1 Tax=Massilia sp. TaxID=1882437 RepID=UPI00352D2D26
MTDASTAQPESISMDPAVGSDRPAMTLIVSTPRPLTDKQRQCIRNEITPHLPADVGMVVLDSGFTWGVVGKSGPELEVLTGNLAPGELIHDAAPTQILAELKGLRAELADQREVWAAIQAATARFESYLCTP